MRRPSGVLPVRPARRPRCSTSLVWPICRRHPRHPLGAAVMRTASLATMLELPGAGGGRGAGLTSLALSVLRTLV